MLRVGDLFPNLVVLYGNGELRSALLGPKGRRLKAHIAFACSTVQVRALRYLFPAAKVDWVSEVKNKDVVIWLNKIAHS